MRRTHGAGAGGGDAGVLCCGAAPSPTVSAPSADAGLIGAVVGMLVAGMSGRVALTA